MNKYGFAVDRVVFFLIFLVFSLFTSFDRAAAEREKPVLTLYTKNPCPLCDDLVEELQPFMHRVRLKKVDITRMENLKYLKLYRYDIPVLHFNGEFLCMHRLDVPLLQEKLSNFAEFESE